MVTVELFRDDAYLPTCQARVVAAAVTGIVLDQTVFYPRGGGQPGDSGLLQRAAGEAIRIVDTCKDEAGRLLHVPAENAALPEIGERLEARIDWQRRYAHMRMHTGLHLLGAVLRYAVTGGAIGEQRSRLDFDMQEGIDKDEVTARLNELVRADHPVRTRWITDEELDARPELIRTMSVQPPRGAGRIRLLEIPGVDLQPCGGTHVAQTGEIGPLRIVKVEKKGRHNRRVQIELA